MQGLYSWWKPCITFKKDILEVFNNASYFFGLISCSKEKMLGYEVTTFSVHICLSTHTQISGSEVKSVKISRWCKSTTFDFHKLLNEKQECTETKPNFVEFLQF